MYTTENLINENVEKAMDIIDEVEAAGGMTAYINSGMAKLRIEEKADRFRSGSRREEESQ